jgi:hypothetical protein
MPLDQVQTWGDLLWETLRALNTLTTLGGPGPMAARMAAACARVRAPRTTQKLSRGR